jgi:hypothetical protein
VRQRYDGSRSQSPSRCAVSGAVGVVKQRRQRHAGWRLMDGPGDARCGAHRRTTPGSTTTTPEICRDLGDLYVTHPISGQLRPLCP